MASTSSLVNHVGIGCQDDQWSRYCNFHNVVIHCRKMYGCNTTSNTLGYFVMVKKITSYNYYCNTRISFTLMCLFHFENLSSTPLNKHKTFALSLSRRSKHALCPSLSLRRLVQKAPKTINLQVCEKIVSNCIKN